MHFCIKCDNMYYIRLTGKDSNQLIYYCRNCGNEDSAENMDTICISHTDIIQAEKKYTHIINRYTRLDPTLPRTNLIKCPNDSCISNTDEQDNEILYIRYDDINMKYIYLCGFCDTMWKTDEQK